MDPELAMIINRALVKIEAGFNYSRHKMVDGICFGIKAFGLTCIGLPAIAIGGEKCYRIYRGMLDIFRELDRHKHLEGYSAYREMADTFRELDRHAHLDDKI